MANVQYTHDLGHPGYHDPYGEPQVEVGRTIANLVNFTGGLLSIALIAGITFWGYKLIVRDVSGLPIVRAAEGEMRVKPVDPGGQLALHQGLAVNLVAAEGSAAGPAERLVLAPQPTDLAEEDKPQILLAAKAITVPEPVEITPTLEESEIDALVRELTSGVERIDVEPTVTEDTDAVDLANVGAGGLATSLRPQVRPRRTLPVATPVAAAVVKNTRVTEVDPASLPAGTRLVQLGAYDSADVARVQWERLNTRFGDYLVGKNRVIQQAQSGGRTFFRLRAMGFDDLSDARRFCSALVAEGADCIPVVTR